MSEKNDPNGSGSNNSSIAIRPVALTEPLDGDVVRCKICEIGCVLAPGMVGVCKVRGNRGGTLVTSNYGVLSRADLETIERRHFYHFFPGSKIFSLGGFGQNFPAIGNEDQYAVPPTENQRVLSIDRIIKFTIDQRCRGVVFGYNEPSMWYEYLFDAVRTVKANGMYTGILTNGYFTPEVLDILGHYLDGILLEINSFTDETFKVLTGQSQFQKILETANRAQSKYKIHLEISTRLVPGVNDNIAELRGIAAWIKQVLGENTAWHLSMAVDEGHELLGKVKALGEEIGLKYIYIHDKNREAFPIVESNDGTPQTSNDHTAGGHTFCHKCHKLLIARFENATRSPGLEKDHCTYCGAESGVHSTIWKL